MTKKKKTSLTLDLELWQEWAKFVVDKTGSTRKLSEEVEKALKEYMERHGNQKETNNKIK